MTASMANVPPLMPRPAHLHVRSGFWTLTPSTAIVCSAGDRESRRVAGMLANMLRPATGYDLPVKSSLTRAGSAIEFQRSPKGPLGTEGYRLDVTPQRVRIAASTPAGLFYGIQTLRQLLPPDIFSPQRVTRTPWRIPCVSIRDTPRFAWRGLMLDVCRHFFDKAFIFRFLDLMALHKLNTFHFHLTEDQAWRIAIRRYPELTAVGARRASSPLRGNRDAQDGLPYGPYYFTQDDIREIVAYAAERFITVVPEIEMPGHALAALSARPELSCAGGPFQPRTRWGVEPDVYCAGKEATFRFLQNVLDEVIGLFPGTFFHIGGDECPKERWKDCPDCQARMRAEHLKDEHELQRYFVQRMERYLRSKGRRLIGWDEILEGGLADGAAVMSWRGTQGGIAAALAGHDVVMSPNSNCYLDYYQSADKAAEPEAIGGELPLAKVYAYDPMPAELPPAKRRHILGVQGNLWSEYLFNWYDVDYMAYPRATALAEVAWTPQADRDYGDFIGRMATHASRLERLGVNFRRLRPGDRPPEA